MPPLVFGPHDQIKWLEPDFVAVAETAFDPKPIKKTCGADLGYNPNPNCWLLRPHSLRPLVPQRALSSSSEQKQNQYGEHRACWVSSQALCALRPALRSLRAASRNECVSTIIRAYRLAFPKDKLAGLQNFDMIQNTSCVPPRIIRGRRIVRLSYVRR
jgi:hypothetical protein